MKLIGLLFVIICTSLIGFERAKKLESQVSIINDITEFLSQMKIQLNFCNSSTRELLNTVLTTKSNNNLSFLKKCVDKYDDDEFDSLWEHEVRSANLSLKKEDIEMLVAFGRGLGTTDLDGQLEMCSVYEERFARRLDFYTEFKKSHSKLYVSFGFFAGLVIAIILI